MRGPIDYIIAGFEGNKFDGSILEAIAEAIDNGVIALVALSLVSKDADGNVTAINIAETDDLYAAEFAQKYIQDDSDIIDEEDIQETADLLENNTSAGLLIIEQLWAKPLKEALLKANGVLVAEGRIHPDAALELSDKGGK